MIDIGSSSLRAGYAGDDTPKAIIPTSYGYIPEPSSNGNGDVEMADAQPTAGTKEGTNNPNNTDNFVGRPKAKLYIGQNGPSIWRSGMEISTPMENGLSEFLFCVLVRFVAFAETGGTRTTCSYGL